MIVPVIIPPSPESMKPRVEMLSKLRQMGGIQVEDVDERYVLASLRAVHNRSVGAGREGGDDGGFPGVVRRSVVAMISPAWPAGHPVVVGDQHLAGRIDRLQARVGQREGDVRRGERRSVCPNDHPFQRVTLPRG